MRRCLSIILYVFLINIFVVSGQGIVDKVDFSLYAVQVDGAQSAACYGDYLILVSKNASKMTLYNLHSRNVLYVCRMNPKTEMRGNIDIYHANNSSFGRFKYDEKDPFPLLYVSHRENNDMRGVLEVYRIIPFRRNRTEDYDSLTIEQVQTVYYPVMTDENAMGSPWTVIDPDNDFMYTYSRNNRSKSLNYKKCRLSKFVIPSLRSFPSLVQLDDNDILNSYDLGFDATLSQGACINKGKLFIAQGVPKKNGKLFLRVIDLKKGKLIRTYNLLVSGFNDEPEGCFIYKNKLMVTTIKKNIYQFNIPIE